MLQTGGELDLALEPLGAERGGEIGVQYLQRDVTIVLEIAGEIDRGHPTAAEDSLQQVPAAERVGEGMDDF